jgi:hypothetical protein
MTGIEVGDMMVAEIAIAIEQHMAEAQIHMETAYALLQVASARVVGTERETVGNGWLQ